MTGFNIAAWTALFACIHVQASHASSPWSLIQSAHFEIYYEGRDDTAGGALASLEKLHSFFERSGLKLDDRGPVRVIGFGSLADYSAYRLRPIAK